MRLVRPANSASSMCRGNAQATAGKRRSVRTNAVYMLLSGDIASSSLVTSATHLGKGPRLDAWTMRSAFLSAPTTSGYSSSALQTSNSFQPGSAMAGQLKEPCKALSTTTTHKIPKGKQHSVSHLYNPEMVQVTVSPQAGSTVKRSFTIPKALICSRSEYFEKMFQGVFAETRNGLAKLNDVAPWVFRCFVGWLHTHRIFHEPGQVDAVGFHTTSKERTNAYSNDDTILSSDECSDEETQPEDEEDDVATDLGQSSRED